MSITQKGDSKNKKASFHRSDAIVVVLIMIIEFRKILTSGGA
ncbi:hypothetical protein J2Y40_003634 [Chryseobacterium sp. 2987]|nr:hypothetical protein [Chryseobacterium sp. 2987]